DDLGVLEWPSLALGVHPQRDRGACAEGARQEIERRWRGIFAPKRDRLVDAPVVLASIDVVSELSACMGHSYRVHCLSSFSGLRTRSCKRQAPAVKNSHDSEWYSSDQTRTCAPTPTLFSVNIR